MLSVLEYLGLEHHPFATIALISSIEFAYSHNEDIVRNIEKPKIPAPRAENVALSFVCDLLSNINIGTLEFPNLSDMILTRAFV